MFDVNFYKGHNTMKKTKYLTNIILIIFLLCSNFLYAEVIEIESKVISTGSKESFSITINNAPDIVNSFGFDIKFCPEVLQYDGYEEGSLIKNQYSFFQVNHLQPQSLLRVGMIYSRNKQIEPGTTGNLLKLNFTALQAGSCEMTIINKVDDIQDWSVKTGWFHSSDPILANSHSFTINEDTAHTGVLTSTNPKKLTTLTYHIIAPPSKGQLTLTNASTGTFAYTPFLNETGEDSFQFVVNDTKVDSVPATVSINIDGINDPPMITPILNQFVYESTSDPITCTVSDPDDPVSKVIVTATSSNEAIIPNNSQHITVSGYGSVRTIYITPAEKSFGKAIITVRAADQQQVFGFTRFTVIAEHQTYTIFTQAYTNGNMGPVGAVKVNKDDDLLIKIKPDDGYEIDTMWIDSERLWNPVPIYTFWKVSDHHTITATFKEAPSYTISTASVPPEGGSITPANKILSKGKNQLIKVMTNPRYALDDLIIDGASMGAVKNYMISDISQSLHLTAVFSIAVTPVADFSSSYTRGSMPYQVNFYDQSQHSIKNWSWDFGDGGKSSNPNPTHTYITPGTYTVTLNVSGVGGDSTIVKQNYVNIDASCMPSMDFSVDNRLINKGTTVFFSHPSFTNYSSLVWNFGDGYTSTSDSPSHTYTEPGYYTVTLATTFGSCKETRTKSNFMIVNGRIISGNVQPALSDCLIEVWDKNMLIASSTTDQSGAYQVLNLPLKNELIVSIRPPLGNNAYQSQYYDGTANGTKLPEKASKISTKTGDIVIDFTLQSVPQIAICGSVLDANNNGIPNTQITVYSETGSLVRGQTDQNGDYQIMGLLSASDYIVFAWSETDQREFFYAIPSEQTPGTYQPTYSVFTKDTATQIAPANPCISNIDIILKSESIKGRVLTESSVPVPFAKVNAWSDAFRTGNFTSSDENGYYTITGLTPLTKTDDYANLGYVVEVLKSVYPYQAYNIGSSRSEAIRVFTNIDGIDFRLKETSTISGSIKDKYLSAIPYATVCATPVSGGVEICSESSLSGLYDISGLYFQDDYIVYAFTSSFPAQYYDQTSVFDDAKAIQLQPFGVTGIDFIFDEGAIIQGEIKVESGSVPADIYVNLRSKVAGLDSYVKAEADGTFKFIQLDYNVSDYIVSIFTDGYLPGIYNSNATVSTWSGAENIGPSETAVRTITLSKGVTIKGSITHLNEPVADVFVEAFSNETLMASDFSTNYLLDGTNYEITGLPSNVSYDIHVTHDTLVAQPQTITATKDEIVNFTLAEPNLSISGSITGVPKSKKIQVTAWTLTNQSQTISLVGTGNVLEYTIGKLKPDENYYVDIICQGFPYQIYNGKNNVSSADVVALTTASSNYIDFTLVQQTGQISGNVNYPEGASSGDTIFISAFSSVDSPRYEVSTVLDVNCSTSSGCDVAYIIDGLNPNETYYLSITSDKYKTFYYSNSANGANKLNDAVKVDPKLNKSIDLIISKGLSISGSVVTASGAGVANLVVEAWSTKLDSLGKAKTDKNGLFIIYGLDQTDDYIVYAIKPGVTPYFYTKLGTVRNSSSAEGLNPAVSQNIEIIFDEGESISGIVFDADGVRLEGIWVRAESKSKHIQSGVFTLSDGSYQLLNLPSSNDYIISAQPIHTYMPSSKTNVSSATSNINFYLDTGYTVSGKVLDSSGNGISDIEVSLFSKSLSYLALDRSDSSGNYQISGVPEGNDFLFYVTSVGQNSYVPSKESGFSVSANVSKNIVLKQGFSISGYVYTDQSESIAYTQEARITAFSKSMSFFGDAITDLNGYYKIVNLPDAADYSLEIFPSSGYANQVKNDQLASATVNFVLSSGGTISGSVINSTGEVVSGAGIEISSETGNIFESTSTDRNGDYAINGLQMSKNGQMITDFLIFVYADGFPPHSSVGKSTGDTVNFILSSGDANMITGLVMDSSGELPPSDFTILIRTFFQDTGSVAAKPLRADENGAFTVTGLDSNKSYQFLFKAYQNNSIVFDQWAGTNESGISDKANARAYGTDEAVRFKFDGVWGSK